MDSKEHFSRKRPVDKLENTLRINKVSQSIYINNKSSFRAQLASVKKAIDNGFNEIFLHATGACITRAVQIALQANEDNYDAYELWPYTDTIQVSDDMEALSDDVTSYRRVRLNPAIHVKMCLKTQ